MTQIFSHIVVWFRSLSLFKKSTYSVSKPINLLLALLFGLLIIFVLYVYVKIMQVPQLEDKWDRFYYGTQCDTLNIIICHNFSNEPEGKVVLHVPDCPELQRLSQRDFKTPSPSGIIWINKPRPKNFKYKSDVLKYVQLCQEDSLHKEFELDEFIENIPDEYLNSLKSLDYCYFDYFSITNPSSLQQIIQSKVLAYSGFSSYETYYGRMYSHYYSHTSKENALRNGRYEFRKFTGISIDNDYEFVDEIKVYNGDYQSWRDHASHVWGKLYDVSRVNYRLSIPDEHSYINSLAVYFTGPTEFLPMYPEPDVVDRNYIAFLDPEKLKYIQNHSLEFDAKFPFSENTQNMKIFVLTSVITVLLTLFFRQVYILIRPYLKKIKTKTFIISLSAIFLVILIWMILSLRPIII